MKLDLLLALAIAATLSGCRTSDEAPSTALGVATLITVSGAPAGTARLRASGFETSLSISLSGMPKGLTAVQLHTTGSCEPPDFSSAGAPLNLMKGEHDPAAGSGADLSDLPAVIGESGTGTISVLLTGTPEEIAGRIFDADGTALIVHARAADSPTYSDVRIACGILVPG